MNVFALLFTFCYVQFLFRTMHSNSIGNLWEAQSDCQKNTENYRSCGVTVSDILGATVLKIFTLSETFDVQLITQCE